MTPVHNSDTSEQLGFALAGLDVPFDGNADIQVSNTETPECPTCEQQHSIYCLECGDDHLACQCDPDEYESYFWCLNCDAEFLWDPNFLDDDELWDDVENDVVDVTVRDALECKCSPVKQYVCGVCNVERDKPEDEWRPYRSVHGQNLLLMEKESIAAGETAKPECKCEPECNYYCAKCKVRRGNPQDEWEWLSESQKKTITQAQAADKKQSAATKAKTAKTVTSGSWSSYGYGGTGWYKCRHYGESLTFPDGTQVWASSSNSTRKPGEFVPDFGLYLDWTWKPTWRAEFIDWRDFGLPTNEEAAVEAIVDMHRRAKEGWKIEVGCIGGHGRTGTALACMGVLSGLSPKEAIKYVRKNYCTETLENAKQEWWVEWFDAYVNLKPLPKMPDFPTKTYTTTGTKTTSTTKSTSCTLEEHYKMWRAGATACTIKASGSCSFWTQDKKRFDKNDIPDNLRAKDAEIDAEIAAKEVTVSMVIDGFIVPKPKRGESQHTPNARQGCKCDYCRYTAKHGAFLTPTAKPDKIKIACANGEVIDISIDNAKFRPLPPAADGGYDGVTFDDYVWSDEHGWVWHKLNQGSAAEKKAASEKLADALETSESEDVAVSGNQEIAERPTEMPDNVQEPEELVTPYTLKVLTAGLRDLLDRAPTTNEIRIAIKEFSDVEWLDTIHRGEVALSADGCLICSSTDHATDHHYYCITCKDWSDHKTTQHDQAMRDLQTGSEVPIYCLGCKTYTTDHRTVNCPSNAEIEAHIAAKDAEIVKRDRNKKKHKRTKGGAKSKQQRKLWW